MKSTVSDPKPLRDPRLTAINFVSDAVNRALDLREIAENALHSVLAVMKLDAGAIYIWQEDRRELLLWAERGFDRSFVEKVRTIAKGFDPTIDAVLGGAPQQVDDLELAADPPRRPAPVAAGFRAALLTPILAQGYVLGILVLGAHRARRFSAADTDLVEAICNQVGHGLVHAQLQADLRASEEQYRLMVENSDDAIYITDQEARPLFANPAFERTLGYTVAELAALEPLARIHMDDASNVASAVSSLANGGVVRNLEYRFQHKDGSWIDLQCHARVYGTRGETARQFQFIVREVTETKRRQAQLIRRNRQLAALSLLADVANSSLNIEEIARNTLQVALQTTAMDGGCIHLAEPGQRQLRLYVEIGLPSTMASDLQSLRFGEGVIGQVAASGEAQVLANLSTATSLITAVDLVGFRGLIVVPVRAKGELLGTLALISRRELQQPTEVAEMIQAIGNQLASALVNARLYEVQLRENDKLAALVEIGGQTAQRLELDPLLQRVLDQSARLLKADAAYMIRFTESQEMAEVVAASGPDPLAGVVGARASSRQGLSGLVRQARRGRIFSASDLDEHGWGPIPPPAAVRSVMVAPLMARQAVIGALALVRHGHEARAFAAADLELLEVFAGRAAVGIDSTQLFDDLQKKNHLLQLLMEEAHHRIKNNLQMVSGLLQLQAEGVEEDSATLHFRNANARIHAIAHVHNLLSQEMPDKVDARALINVIVDSLVMADDPRLNPPRVTTEIEALWLSSEQAVAVALVVNEVLSNSLLHGRPPAGAPLRLSVVCVREGERVRLRLADNGGGLPAADPPRAAGGQGMNIIHQLVQVNLRGRLELASRDGGLTTEVEFDLLHPGAPPPSSTAGAALALASA